MVRAIELTRLCGHRCPQHPRGATGGFPSPLSACPRASVWAVSTRGSVTSWTSSLAPFPRTGRAHSRELSLSVQLSPSYTYRYRQESIDGPKLNYGPERSLKSASESLI